MAGFNRYLVFIFLVALLAACKSKKTSLSGEDQVDYGDFVGFFHSVKLPYQFEDTSLMRRDDDSLLISYNVFSQFVPDSVLERLFGKGAKPEIYPMAKVVKDDTYLFAKAVTGNKRMAFVAAFNKKKDFVAAMPMLQLDQSSATEQNSGIDSKLTLFKSITRKNANGSISDGKDAYFLNNDAHDFTLIMHDPLDEVPGELINPIDTLSRKQKYSADYGTGKTNLVSIRDSRKAERFNFFIHFEKNKGECTGELKGLATMKSATQAEYHEAGEPCGLRFDFSPSGVRIKELGGCGSSRGLRCSFDGFYPRKKEPKPKPAKTKRHGK